MTIYLVRHGESKSNYDNKHFRSYFCGQLDVPLTDTGTKSADDLCDYFKEKQIKHVYVSDLLRTQQTFEHIFPYDIASTTTPLLRERSLGVFEGEYKMKSVRIRNMINISMIQTLKTFVIVFHKKRLKEKVMKMYINA